MQISFNSARPNLSMTHLKGHPNQELAVKYEQAINDPAYLNPQDPRHLMVRDAAQWASEQLWPANTTDGGQSQPFGVHTIQTGAPTVADGRELPPDEM